MLDISSKTGAQGEQCLLGLTFSPDGRHLYVNFTDRSGDSRIIEYSLSSFGRDNAGEISVLSTEGPIYRITQT